jgi:hypothetical protein
VGVGGPGAFGCPRPCLVIPAACSRPLPPPPQACLPQLAPAPAGPPEAAHAHALPPGLPPARPHELAQLASALAALRFQPDAPFADAFLEALQRALGPGGLGPGATATTARALATLRVGS